MGDGFHEFGAHGAGDEVWCRVEGVLSTLIACGECELSWLAPCGGEFDSAEREEELDAKVCACSGETHRDPARRGVVLVGELAGGDPVIPKLVFFVLILIIGYFIAKAIGKAVDAILERVGFDRAVERGGIKKALAGSKLDASDILAKLVFYALMLLVLQLAFGVFGPNPVSDMLNDVIAYLPKVIAALLIIIVVAAIAAAVREMIDAALGGLSYGTALANAAGIAITVVGVFAALDQLEVAPAIVTGLFYAVLAIFVGVTVIAVGGGGITPMRSRWENALAKYDEEKPKVARSLAGCQGPDRRTGAAAQGTSRAGDPQHRRCLALPPQVTGRQHSTLDTRPPSSDTNKEYTP